MTAYADPARPGALDVVLRTTAELLGSEVTYFGRHDDDGMTLVRVWARSPGAWPGIADGAVLPAGDAPCARMLDGGPSLVPDTATDPTYRDSPGCTSLGIRAYAGVPVTGPDGGLLGTLAGIDRRPTALDDTVLPALRGLAAALGSTLQPGAPTPGARIVRTRGGWVVETADGEVRPAPDLMSAMVVADLLAADLEPPARPARPAGELDDAARLRLSVVQLEHALASRVLIEQAIGVLAERWQVTPRAAFEKLRRVARGQGRRVYDLAVEIVASTSTAAASPDFAVDTARGRPAVSTG